MATADDVQVSSVTSGSSNPLVQLLQHQTKAADIVKEKVKKLTKFKEDYEALKARLESLPDKVSHQVMVPFGSLAFVPGRVKHTNEILCLLGDNWFVERSAKQAAKIVERRIQGCNESLKRFDDELKLVNSWCDQANKFKKDLNQGLNILETEEEDEQWREEHRKRVREYKQKMAALKQASAEESHERSEEEELFRRLDELEMEEELQDELAKLGVGNGDIDWGDELVEEEEEEEDEAISVEEPPEEEEEPQEEENKKKSVRWSESPDAVKQFRRDELILPGAAHDGHEEDKNQDTLKITFKHSPVSSSSAAASSNKRKAKFASFIAEADPSSSSSSVVSSPSEIFRKFRSHTTEPSGGEPSSSSEPKSILKVKKSTTPVIEIVQRQKQKQKLLEEEGPDASGPAADPDRSSLLQQQQITAVGDEVKERGETASSQVGAAAEGGGDESVNTHRPVSRFRAARMGKKL
ncbi:RNA polymerase II subunit 5-mediating protein homolog [Daphnia pulex]|uniref:RNA polymerase II subunit 5-mediating protein homolog n=1 Tax=Daphnia pulex TaxID=6669 RepID=UPI001EDD7E6E|nr:RNA polymerase II subunit 5-mediating protein homolog [Daphnia pulex]